MKKNSIFFLVIIQIIYFAIYNVNAATIKYQYDDLHRLIMVERVGEGITEYKYDELGNRTEKKVSKHLAPLFSVTPISGQAPLSVEFTDQSTGSISSWEWNFDIGNAVDSTQQNPIFTYNTPGVYKVILTVTGPSGKGVKSLDKYILVEGTYPNDSDSDGIPDSVELDNETDPKNHDDALLDLDGDGYSNLREYLSASAINDPSKTPLTESQNGLIADFDKDLDVDGLDMSICANEFGRQDCSSTEQCSCDLNMDNKVDKTDLYLLSEDFGKCIYCNNENTPQIKSMSSF